MITNIAMLSSGKGALSGKDIMKSSQRVSRSSETLLTIPMPTGVSTDQVTYIELFTTCELYEMQKGAVTGKYSVWMARVERDNSNWWGWYESAATYSISSAWWVNPANNVLTCCPRDGGAVTDTSITLYIYRADNVFMTTEYWATCMYLPAP